MPPFDTDVLIAGAGPVGLTLAMDLASRGVRVTLAEPRRFAEPPNVKCNHVAARTHGDVPPPRRGAEACAMRACRPTTRTTWSFRTSVTGHRAHAHPDPVPARPLHRHRAAPTAGGPRRSRRTASTRSTSSRSCCAHAAALPGVTLLNRTQLTGFAQDDARRRRATARPRQRRHAQHPLRATWSAATAAAPRVRKTIGAQLEGTAVIQRVQSTYIRAPRLARA